MIRRTQLELPSQGNELKDGETYHESPAEVLVFPTGWSSYSAFSRKLPSNQASLISIKPRKKTPHPRSNHIAIRKLYAEFGFQLSSCPAISPARAVTTLTLKGDVL